MSWTIERKLQEKLDISLNVSKNLVRLLDKDENTPTFVARYRRGDIGDMTPEGVFTASKCIQELKEIQKKSKTLIGQLEKLNKLTPLVKKEIIQIDSIDELNETIKSYKGTKSTALQKAIEQGAEQAFEQVKQMLASGRITTNRIRHNFRTSNELFAAIAIIILPDILLEIQKKLNLSDGDITVRVTESKSKICTEKEKYKNYFGMTRQLRSVAHFQYLALLRGEKQKALSIQWDFNGPKWNRKDGVVNDIIANKYGKNILFERILMKEIGDLATKKISAAEMRRVKANRRKSAEDDSCHVFGRNLRALLLQNPQRCEIILAIDPGFTNGCKCAVIDIHGDPKETFILYLNRRSEMKRKLESIIQTYHIDLIGIGDGKGCRETEKLVAELIQNSKYTSKTHFCRVREAGVSIYSCSPIGLEDLPKYEPGERSAISLGRRVLNPVGELVKVSPEHLGIGQYQHDISQKKLNDALTQVVEECVSYIGVDLNSSGIHLLSKVCGLNNARAAAIVQYRIKNGTIKSRDELRKIKGIGPKSFQQAAGFLRIYNGAEKLDSTWIHPESYDLAKKFIKRLNSSTVKIGTANLIKKSEECSSDIMADLISECENDKSVTKDNLKMIQSAFEQREDNLRTGRDIIFRKTLLERNDLKVNHEVIGQVMNTTSFGSFVDIGLDKDGLIHSSKSNGIELQPNQSVLVVIESINGDRIGLRLRKLL